MIHHCDKVPFFLGFFSGAVRLAPFMLVQRSTYSTVSVILEITSGIFGLSFISIPCRTPCMIDLYSSSVTQTFKTCFLSQFCPSIYVILYRNLKSTIPNHPSSQEISSVISLYFYVFIAGTYLFYHIICFYFTIFQIFISM